MIALSTTQTHVDGFQATAYKVIAQGETYPALLRDAEALGANAVLNSCFDGSLSVETLFHGAAVVIEPLAGVSIATSRAAEIHAPRPVDDQNHNSGDVMTGAKESP
jgi:hypothetical protein